MKTTTGFDCFCGFSFPSAALPKKQCVFLKHIRTALNESVAKPCSEFCPYLLEAQMCLLWGISKKKKKKCFSKVLYKVLLFFMAIVYAKVMLKKNKVENWEYSNNKDMRTIF